MKEFCEVVASSHSACSVEVSPFDIESELLEHPAVAECAAVSSPDEVNLTGTVSLPST